MFKHPKCGGRHETILQAKECEANAKFAAETEAGHAHFLATGRDEEAEAFLASKPNEAQSAILDSLRRPLAGSVAEAAQPFGFGPIGKTAILSKRVDSLLHSGARTAVRHATENQLNFLAVLTAERDLSGLSAEVAKTVSLFEADVDPSFEQASNAIGELKLQPKAASARAAKAESHSAWRKLAEAIPEGRYALPTGPGQDKPHFYRLTKRNGFVKLQEQASDSLYPIELKNYKTIFEAILAFDVEKAGRLYGELIGSCRRCGRTLTDENNPYLEMGYGPDCGAKV